MARMMNNKNGGRAEERPAVAEAGGEEKGTRGRLKKGPWTAAEDAILVEYVKKKGEGNWNAVQKNSGLSRCGKSCRLRWANHLRPNLKKGAFSLDEERIIIDLHAKLGNKWARMATQLPGRTDNEIKNYWNTRMKRRQRAGLPLYHQELQHHHQQPLVPELHQITQNPQSSSSNSFSSLLSQNKPNLTLYNNFSHPTNINHIKYNIGGCNFALPINSHVSHFTPNDNHTLPITPSLQYNCGGTFGTLSSMLTGPPFDPLGRLMATELPSTQTPASSDASGGGGMSLMGRADLSSSNTAHDEYYDFLSRGSRLGNSGLLDDLLVEARALSRNDGAKQRNGGSYKEAEKGKCVAREESEEEVEEEEDGVQSKSILKNSGETSTGDDENRTENFSSCDQSSNGIEASDDPLDLSTSMDDDLMSLLNYFPTSMPDPDWHRRDGGNTSNMETYAATSGVARHSVVDASPKRVSKHDQSLNCYWNNMPGIC